jgi:hypothetical protein
MSHLDTYKKAFKNYQGNKFSSYIGNPYELVQEWSVLINPFLKRQGQ